MVLAVYSVASSNDPQSAFSNRFADIVAYPDGPHKDSNDKARSEENVQPAKEQSGHESRNDTTSRKSVFHDLAASLAH